MKEEEKEKGYERKGIDHWIGKVNIYLISHVGWFAEMGRM